MFRAGINIARHCNTKFASFSTLSNRNHYDVLIVGGGAFGSAALYHLAKLRHLKVGLLEQFAPGHDLGSSHGESRITRLAYFEGQEYLPVIKRSLAATKQLEEETHQELFYKTGMLDIHGVFERSLATAKHHNLQHEVLTGADVNRRFPGYRLPEHWKALYHADGGILKPEAIIKAQCDVARELGAQLHSGERVVRWTSTAADRGGDGAVEVHTNSGATYHAAQVVFCGGAWMTQLVPELKAVLGPVRQVVTWFAPADPQRTFRKEAFPVFVIQETDDGGVSRMGQVVGEHQCYYGFPQWGSTPGFKIGRFHQSGEIASPDALERDVTPADVAALRSGVQRYFPGADGPVVRSSVCMFTNTPDTHFIIDRHPTVPQVLLCSACSGHGFKMSSGVGELIADMVVHGGRGSEAIQEELRLHRIGRDRQGHDKLLDAFHI